LALVEAYCCMNEFFVFELACKVKKRV